MTIGGFELAFVFGDVDGFVVEEGLLVLVHLTILYYIYKV